MGSPCCRMDGLTFTLWLLVMDLYGLIEVSATQIVQHVLRVTKRIFQLTYRKKQECE
jgi:hypothetical protein